MSRPNPYCTCGHLRDRHAEDGSSCLEMVVVRRKKGWCSCSGFTEGSPPAAEERPRKLDAKALIELLRARHAEDVFVPECKNGPTHYPVGGLLKLDAWVMTRSWAHWTTIGYEVKVSRADFEQDQKYVGYLPLCHQFSFVCPPGLIRGADLPKGVGLLWASANGEHLHVKVKPEPHDVDPERLQALMSYVLMSRAVVVADMHEANRGVAPAEQTRLQRLQAARDWVEEQAARKQLALLVRGHVRERVEAAERALADAQTLNGYVREFTERLAKLGIVWDAKKSDWGDRYRVDREIDQLVGACDRQTLNAIEEGGKKMLEAVATIRRLRDEKAAPAAEGG